MGSINIEKYKKAISDVFYTVISKKNFEGDRNPFYYCDLVSNFSKGINRELNENIDLCSVPELKHFNLIIVSLTQNFVEFFIGVYKYNGYDSSKIDLSYDNILINFGKLNAFELSIKKYYRQEEFLLAKKMKDYSIDLIEKSFVFLDQQIFLTIDSCPFFKIKEKLIENLKGSFSNEDISTYLALKKQELLKQGALKREPLKEKTPLNQSLQNQRPLKHPIQKQKPQKKKPEKRTRSKSQNIELSMSQLALKLFCEKELVTRENAKSFLSDTTFTSGDALYNKYIYWSQKLNRRADPGTKLKLLNRIKDYEKVIELLSPKYIKSAKEELQILKNYLENYYLL